MNLQTKLYCDMLRIRRIEEAIEREYKNDEMKTPIHLVIGQEASVVGVCAALRKQDKVFSGHRTHGVYLAKGGDLNAMMAEMYCKVTGTSASRGGSMHLIDKDVGFDHSSAIVGGAVPIATGCALAARMRKEDYICVCFMGDAAVEEGVIWESFNVAALWKLPIIYVCENNGWSVCSPLLKRQPNQSIAGKAQQFGLLSHQIDGNNIMDVYRNTLHAMEFLQKEQCPQFLEIKVNRWRAHGGSGDDSKKLGYRDWKEVKRWEEEEDPIKLFRPFVDVDDEALEKEIAEEIRIAFEFARMSPVPREEDLATHVYAPLDP